MKKSPSLPFSELWFDSPAARPGPGCHQTAKGRQVMYLLLPEQLLASAVELAIVCATALMTLTVGLFVPRG